jgi:hypothetical protein
MPPKPANMSDETPKPTTGDDMWDEERIEAGLEQLKLLHIKVSQFVASFRWINTAVGPQKKATSNMLLTSLITVPQAPHDHSANSRTTVSW